MADMHTQHKIPCTVGILTFNSARHMRQCLDSVKDFAEIIIADGGSSDETLAIAREYSAKIMQQSEQGKVIEDFALERNRQVEAATQDWFFYVDSDEIVTPELAQDIARVTSAQSPEHLFWDVRMQFSGEGGAKQYRMYKPLYQTRLFNTTTGARFGKRIHEKVRFDHNKYTVGRLESAWLVPLDDYLDFTILKKKAKRNARIIEDWRGRNPIILIEKISYCFLSMVKIALKALYLLFRDSRAERIPIRFSLHMIYEQWYLLTRIIRRYVRNVFSLP
jgi:glycosyltransferase involved in cell wall biosynthesis